MNSLSHLIDAFRELKSQNAPLVLATIVEVAGSTYRKSGARMLIDNEGNLHGLLSGGCLEGDLLEHAKGVLENKKPIVVEYDMRSDDDLVWGLGMGCNGALKIFMEWLAPENNYGSLSQIEQAVLNRKSGVLASVVKCDLPQVSLGQWVWSGESNATSKNMNQALIDSIATQIEKEESCKKPHSITIAFESTEMDVFLDFLTPPIHLLVSGAGPDAAPLLHFAKMLGWYVSLVDHRPAYANPEKLPLADEVHCVPVLEMSSTVDLNQVSAAVIMSHHFESDKNYLQQLLPSSVEYIGLLGPAKRRNSLLSQIPDLPNQNFPQLHNPVGLDIGGESPEEIALSIVAEIQAVLSQRPAQFLKHRDGAIHD